MRRTALLLALAGSLSATAPMASADPGDLDRDFGTNGVVTVALPGADTARGVAIQEDGKIVVVGSQSGQVAVTRLNRDGSLDGSFAGDGSTTVPLPGGAGNSGEEVAIQRDGKIVVGGIWTSTGGSIARLNPNGSLDASFGGGGTGLLGYGRIHAVALTGEDRAVLGGTGTEKEMTLTQLTPSGFFDPIMGGDGNVFRDVSGADRNSQINDLAVQRNGNIVAVGESSGPVPDADGGESFTFDTAVARFNSNGTPDTSFANGGHVLIPGAWETSQLALQPDGGIIVGATVLLSDTGAARTDATIRRLLPNGKPDGAFATGTPVRSDLLAIDDAPELALQDNGKIVAAAAGVNSFQVMRLQPGGNGDSTFAANGRATVSVGTSSYIELGGVTIQRDGAIVVAGTVAGDIVVARLAGDPTGLDALGRGDGGGSGSGPGGSGGGGGRPPLCAGRRATIVGTPGKDRLKGTRRADVIVGLGGADKVDGGGGNDVICAGAGNDSASGRSGNDRVLGEGGNDRLAGGDGKDALAGGSGSDRLAGGSGNDGLTGGSGNDRLDGGSGGDRLSGQGGRDRLVGGTGRDKERQ